MRFSFFALFLILLPIAMAEEYVDMNIKTNNGTVTITTEGNQNNTFDCSRNSEYNYPIIVKGQAKVNEVLQTLGVQKEADDYRQGWELCKEEFQDVILEIERKNTEMAVLKGNQSIAQNCDARIAEFRNLKDIEIKDLKRTKTMLLITNGIFFLFALAVSIGMILKLVKKKGE